MSDPQEPISLMQAAVHLRVVAPGDQAIPADSDLIGDLITSARELVETRTGLVLVPRQITETARELGRWIDLASWPISSIDAIRYPVAGELAPLAATAWCYSLKARPVRVLPVSPGWGVSGAWSCANPALPVEIDVVAGYATPADVPRRAVRAMLLLIDHWYNNRGAAEVGDRAAAIELPLGVSDLLRTLRIRTL